VSYERPLPSPQLVPLVSIHSHASHGAYASATDRWDETHWAGLHVVVGKVGREPPEIHVEAVVDGTRFPVRPDLVLAGYRRCRRKVPRDWIDRVKVKMYSEWYAKRYGTARDDCDRTYGSDPDPAGYGS
jgi:hypothetical protein